MTGGENSIIAKFNEHHFRVEDQARISALKTPQYNGVAKKKPSTLRNGLCHATRTQYYCILLG